ncbi:unnamed protein product, partial [marine sediment metagenome]
MKVRVARAVICLALAFTVAGYLAWRLWPVQHPTLQDAVRVGDLTDVKRHLRHKADVNAQDNQHLMTPLHWAALQGHTRVAKVLLAKGADVNA